MPQRDGHGLASAKEGLSPVGFAQAEVALGGVDEQAGQALDEPVCFGQIDGLYQPLQGCVVVPEAALEHAEVAQHPREIGRGARATQQGQGLEVEAEGVLGAFQEVVTGPQEVEHPGVQGRVIRQAGRVQQAEAQAHGLLELASLGAAGGQQHLGVHELVRPGLVAAEHLFGEGLAAPQVLVDGRVGGLKRSLAGRGPHGNGLLPWRRSPIACRLHIRLAL